MERLFFISRCLFIMLSLSALSPTMATAQGVDSARIHYSLYKGCIKNQQFEKALISWKYVRRERPKVGRSLYSDGAKIYVGLLKKTGDSIYLNGLMKTFDDRITYFGKRGKYLADKAIYLNAFVEKIYENAEDRLSAKKKVHSILKESILLEKGSSTTSSVLLFMQTTLSIFQSNSFSQEDVIQSHQLAKSTLDLIKENEKNPTAKDAEETIEKVDKMLTQSGAADCEIIGNLYRKALAKNTKDIEQIKKYVKGLKQQGCTASPIYAQMVERVYRLEPSPQAAVNLGELFLKKGDIRRGLEYYYKAVSQETDPEQKSDHYLRIAVVQMKDVKDKKQAKKFCKLAITVNKKNGQAYLLLAQIYASSAKDYSTKDFDQRTVYWVAHDYALRAKQADDKVAKKANELLKNYAKFFPRNEDIFFEGIKVGSSFHVKGWINERTTVRAAK